MSKGYLKAGESFARLTALEDAAGCNDKILWRCSCGTEKRTDAGPVRTGYVRSCGCLQREKARAQALIIRDARPPKLTPEERREANIGYQAAYRERHREEIRARNREWANRKRETDREAMRARERVWEEANRERRLRRRQGRYEKTRERRRAQDRQRYAADPERQRERVRRQRQARPEHYREIARRSQKANRATGYAAASRRRQRRRVAMDKIDRLLSAMYRLAIASDPCFYCGTTEGVFHVDHYVPLALGATDHWFNLVHACARCNRRKHAMHGDDFIALLRREAEAA